MDVVDVIKTVSIRSYRAGDFYHNYYMTQVVFNHGGSLWRSWARRFQSALQQSQARAGYWNWESEFHAGENDKIIATSLGCLMLAVFYRYPPTHLKNKLKDIVYEDEEVDFFDE